MNRSTFHTRLARATVAVVLAVSAIGCATAPESTPTSQTPPAELASEPHEQRTTELPDVSLQSPVANPPEADSPSLEEPSSVWIDDTLARQTPLQPTEVAVQPPPPEIDARSAVAWSSAPATVPESLAPTQAVAPTTVAPVAADPAADRSLALIEPRVPAGERPASAETVSPTTPSGATPSGATPSRPATTNPVRAVPSASSPGPVTSAAAPLAQGALRRAGRAIRRAGRAICRLNHVRCDARRRSSYRFSLLGRDYLASGHRQSDHERPDDHRPAGFRRGSLRRHDLRHRCPLNGTPGTALERASGLHRLRKRVFRGASRIRLALRRQGVR